MIEKMKAKETFQRLEVGTGDIVTYCEELTPEELKDLELPNVGAYYESVLNSVSVHFRDRNAPKDTSKQFILLLSKKMNYEAVNEKVAKHLEVDPLLLRFVSHNQYTEGPKVEFKREPEKPLEEMLQPNTYQPSKSPVEISGSLSSLETESLAHHLQWQKSSITRSWKCLLQSLRTRSL